MNTILTQYHQHLDFDDFNDVKEVNQGINIDTTSSRYLQNSDVHEVNYVNKVWQATDINSYWHNILNIANFTILTMWKRCDIEPLPTIYRQDIVEDKLSCCISSRCRRYKKSWTLQMFSVLTLFKAGCYIRHFLKRHGGCIIQFCVLTKHSLCSL